MAGKGVVFSVSGRRLRASRSAWLLLAALIIVAVPLSSRAAAVTNKIAWMASPNLNNWHINIMNLDGSNQRNLSQVSDPNASDQDPHFKPDGSKILFASKRTGDTNMRLYTMDPDGTNVAGLSPNGIGTELSQGKFSWDGAQVVFMWHSGGHDGLGYFQVSNPAGTITGIPNTTNKDYWPVFSPDGQWVAFQRDLGSNLMQIYKIQLDGSKLTPLTDGLNRDEMPYFSPDGKYIIFRRGDGATVNMDIYRISAADGSGLVNLTNTPTVNEDAPCFSWDGAKIAYNGGGSGAYGTEIYTAHPDCSGSKALTTDSNVNYYATFSPLSRPLAVPLGLLLDD